MTVVGGAGGPALPIPPVGLRRASRFGFGVGFRQDLQDLLDGVLCTDKTRNRAERAALSYPVHPVHPVQVLVFPARQRPGWHLRQDLLSPRSNPISCGCWSRECRSRRLPREEICRRTRSTHTEGTLWKRLGYPAPRTWLRPQRSLDSGSRPLPLNFC